MRYRHTKGIMKGFLFVGLGFVVLSTFGACATTPSAGRLIPQDHLAEIQRPDIPLVVNNRVQDWLDYFQGRGRPHFERYLARSRKYIPMMRRILTENGLPHDLVYLSMIESGFNPHAYSRARATGAWQFIYQTGIRYGLKVDSWVDERRDPEKSTVAAAKYLKNLYDRYNNWYLAAAGYNAGEGKIDRAIRKYDTEDFWQLAQGRYLRAETKDYVPKLIAAALIAKSPEKYGFKHIQYEAPIPFKEVKLEGPIDLRIAAKCAGVTYEEIKALNPEILHWVTPPEAGPYSLKVPSASERRFRQKYASLNPGERMGEKKVSVESSGSVRELARVHEVPTVLLAAANGVSPEDTIKAGRAIFLPLDPPEGEELYEPIYEGRRGRHGGSVLAYRVRAGDRIGKISRRTGLSVAVLRRNNPHIDWNNLRKGQRLKLHASAGRPEKSQRLMRRKARRVAVAQPVPGSEAASAATPDVKHDYISHKIQSGDTLSEIAKKYNVSTRHLKSVNRITKVKALRLGRTLKIPIAQQASASSSTAM